MQRYLFKRLLLILPTLLGISLICFTIIQFIPGGPVEEAVFKIRSATAMQGVSSTEFLTEREIDRIREYYGFDKPAPVRFWIWLRSIVVLDFGRSFSYDEPVLSVILQKMPVSLFFGLSSFLLSYLICIPLGMWKALRNGSKGDAISSVFIFSGYVIPSYALGVLLIIFFAGGRFLQWFPLTGIVSDYWEDLGFFARIVDFLHHMTLPLICYMAAELAFLTMLMKNSILEEIHKDYMKAAIARGLSFKQAVRRHALRNALIPIATRMSEVFTLMFAGSIFIEKVFDIDGMGLLAYNSLVSRDYNVVMALIFITSLFSLLGRVFADILYVWVDPRIQLGRHDR